MTTHAAESTRTSIDVTIADLPTCDFTVDADDTTESVKEVFDDRADLVGAIVMDGGRILEVVSRDGLYRHLSRAFFREIFLKRPVREFVEMWCADLLRLESTCTINHAADAALARPHGQAFEPIVVDYGDRVGLLDAQVLLVAQAQLLSLSRLIEEQRDAAEAANRSKSEFLATISHELRTPLHGILSYTKFGLNEAGTADRSELHDFFRNVDHCAENLLRLVNDLLDLSKLEAGRMTFDFQPVELGSLIEVVVDEFRSLCAQQKVSIHYVPPHEPFLTNADPDRFQQVIRNLLSNAVKFSPPDGVIDVQLQRNGPSFVLDVADTGPGIPPDELEAVFDKFVQSSKTKSTKGGTGLGLAICREIITGHGGQVWAENNAGAGCTLRCELPIAASDTALETCDAAMSYQLGI